MKLNEFIRQHNNCYIEDISKTVNGKNIFLGNNFVDMLKEKITMIKEVCEDISSVLDAHDNGFVKNAYDISYQLFEKISPFLIINFKNRRDFYRIREGDFRIKDKDDRKKVKTELFHIKNEMKNKIGAYRYSIAGWPCLYLASDIELAWFECGMPKKFSYCRMLIDGTEKSVLKLVDFSNRPVEFLSSIHPWFINARRDASYVPNEQEIYKVLLQYIVTYPLVAVCSVKVKDRNSKFVEEYIFPQLFMQWLRENSDLDGILYKSALNTDLVRGMGAVNVAFPEFKNLMTNPRYYFH